MRIILRYPSSDLPECLLITSIESGSTNSIRPIGTPFSKTIVAHASESSIVSFDKNHRKNTYLFWVLRKCLGRF